MKFDKTCCGTTCDAKANAEYVAKLEKFVSDIAAGHQSRRTYEHLGMLLDDVCLREGNEELIKHAQQNNSTTE